jgi:hypothetical protein
VVVLETIHELSEYQICMHECPTPKFTAALALVKYARDGKLNSLGEVQYDASGGAGVHPSNIAHLRIAEYVAEANGPLLPAATNANANANGALV